MTNLRNAAQFAAILALLLVANPESGDATDIRIAATDLRGQVVSFLTAG